jgi:copper chaperone
MKNIWILFLAGFFLAACNSSPKQEGNAGNDEAVAAGQWVEVTLEVEGMTCEGCEKAINARLESMDGVASSASSHLDKQTTVKYNPQVTSLDEVKEKITETGYQVKGVKEETKP